jgi:4-amino-4-deoxy-L-arabinose transferase-like glycosyltransferase
MGTKTNFVLLLLICIGTLLRFYDISWGAPYFFHPDERNIASAVTQLSFPTQLNPHFFAYGSLPIYITYFSGVLFHSMLFPFYKSAPVTTISFEQAIIIGRFFSALLSIGLIPLLFSIGKKIHTTQTGLWAAFFATTSVGFIQYAHFSTFEMWLTFFGALLFYYCLLFWRHHNKKILLLIGCIFGVLVSIKVSSIVLLIPLLVLFIIATQSKKTIFKKGVSVFFTLMLFFLSAFLIFVSTNPFIFITPHEFLSSMHYESSVVLGSLPVFYTQGFMHTIPVLYQLRFIFPFILNPLLCLFFLPALLYICYSSIRTRSFPLCLLLLFFLTLFCSQGFFYAKWTRYMIPTLPFIYLSIAITLTDIYTYLHKKNYLHKLLTNILFISISIFCLFYAVCFIFVVYYQKDSRIAAADWTKQHIPSDATSISEVYDLGIVPFNPLFKNITLINFYDLDINATEQNKLQIVESNASYFISPSQRVLKTRTQNPRRFPKGYLFYTNLFAENEYKKIYETSCDIFCTILYLGNPQTSLEETATVFDRPTVTIFKKI